MPLEDENLCLGLERPTPPPPIFYCHHIQRSSSLIDGGMMFVWPSSWQQF